MKQIKYVIKNTIWAKLFIAALVLLQIITVQVYFKVDLNIVTCESMTVIVLLLAAMFIGGSEGIPKEPRDYSHRY